METQAKFIAFEGIDGSGKTTQAGRLISRLRGLGVRCHATKEPTDSPIGSLIRQMLTGRIKADERVLANLFAADRADHLLNETDGLCRKVQDGVTVITDRYYFSSYAYHAVNTGMDIDWLVCVNAVSSDILRPDVTVFLDTAPELAMRRLEARAAAFELFESGERLKSVRGKYFEAFEKLRDVENIAVIDANADEDTVAGRVWEQLAEYF
jgi:dTMP kinase